jgi:DNA-binding beta-propeller fold protein YncE
MIPMLSSLIMQLVCFANFITTGEISSLAGNSCTGSPTNGLGTNAFFSYPNDVSIAPNGLFALITDTVGQRIRKVVLPTGEVTPVAGNDGEFVGSTNGIGTNAYFSSPYGIDISPDGIFALITEFHASNQGLQGIRLLNISTELVTNQRLLRMMMVLVGTNVHHLYSLTTNQISIVNSVLFSKDALEGKHLLGDKHFHPIHDR